MAARPDVLASAEARGGCEGCAPPAAEDDAEARLVGGPHGHATTSGAQAAVGLGGRGLRRAAVGAVALAAGAACAAFFGKELLTRPKHVPESQSDLDALSGLFSSIDDPGPCPPNNVCETGDGCGIPRAPVFYTVGQAFHCLDTNGDLQLTAEELEKGGRGPNTTGSFLAKQHLTWQVSGNGALSYHWFLDGIRQYRDRVYLHESAVCEKIAHWVDHTVRMLPEERLDMEQLPPAHAPPDAAAGTVASIFTFGAPAVSRRALWNAATEDGCFPGVRIYNSGTELIKEYSLRMSVTDPVSWIFSQLGFAHYRSNAMSLHEETPKKQGFQKCKGQETAWLGPRPDTFFWFEGHRPASYEDNLKGLSELIDPAADGSLDWERKPSGGNSGRRLMESTGVNGGLYAGDRVTLKENTTLLRHAFLDVDLPFTRDVEDQVGQPLRVLRIRRPGVLSVRHLGGREGSEWDCARSALLLLKRAEVVKAGSASDAAPIMKAEEGAGGLKAKRIGQLAKIREAAHLAMLGYSSVSEVHADLKGRDWSFISRVDGANASATLVQNRETLECVLAFGLRKVNELDTSANFDPVKSMLHGDPDEEARMHRSLVQIYQTLAGTRKYYDQYKQEKKEGKRIWNHEGSKEKLYGEELPDEDDPYSFIRDATSSWKVRDFCGFKEVQHHILKQLEAIMESPNFGATVTSNLDACGSVTAAGHGLGGALAALWTACANRGLKPGEDGYEDYKTVAWKKGTAKRLPGVVTERATGIVLKDSSTNLGIGVAGSLSAAAAGEGTLRLSPFLDEGWEQRWQLTPEGHLKNPHSGKCLGVSPYGKHEAMGTDLQLQSCRLGPPGRNQRWSLLKSHVLVHRYTGRCLDGHLKLGRCPLTDQRWHLTEEGFIVNRISGKCVDVAGAPGIKNGAKIVQWPCEYTANKTDQLWEFTGAGQVRSKLSGKCIEVDNFQSKQHGALFQPNLVLWDCARADTTYSHAQGWVWSDTGFMVNQANGKCADVFGGNAKKPDGTELVVSSCQRTFPQSSAMWELTEDHYLKNIGKSQAYRNKCVAIAQDVENASLDLRGCETEMRHEWELDEEGHIKTKLGLNQCVGSRGTGDDELALSPCNKTDLGQTWALTEEGFLVNSRTQKCIDIKPYDLTLRQGDCHMTDQRWFVRPSGAIRSRISGLCMDVQGGYPDDLQEGLPLTVWECEHDRAAFLAKKASTDQIWKITDEKTIRNRLTGMCIGLEGDEKTRMYNGARVVQQKCDNSTAQHWDLNLDGFFRNRLSGKCIDVKGPAGHNQGQVLVQYTCEDNPDFSNQIWSFAKASTGESTRPQLPFAVAPRRYATGWSNSSGSGVIVE